MSSPPTWLLQWATVVVGVVFRTSDRPAPGGRVGSAGSPFGAGAILSPLVRAVRTEALDAERSTVARGLRIARTREAMDVIDTEIQDFWVDRSDTTCWTSFQIALSKLWLECPEARDDIDRLRA